MVLAGSDVIKILTLVRQMSLAVYDMIMMILTSSLHMLLAVYDVIMMYVTLL